MRKYLLTLLCVVFSATTFAQHSYLGDWSVVHLKEVYYKNDVLNQQYDNDRTAPYDKVTINADHLYLYEWVSSSSSWKLEGMLYFTVSGDNLVLDKGRSDSSFLNINIVSYDGTTLVATIETTETKVSDVWRDVVTYTLRRVGQEETSGEGGSGGGGSGGDTPVSTGTFQGAKRVFGNRLVKEFHDFDYWTTYTYDDNGYCTSFSNTKDLGLAGKQYTISYGDNITVTIQNNNNPWTCYVGDNGFISRIDYTDDKGKAESVAFLYNTNNQLINIDYGGGDYYDISYDSNGDAVSCYHAADNKTVTVTYGTTLNKGNVMHFEALFGIDLDKFALLGYIGGLGVSSKHLPTAVSSGGSLTWTFDNDGYPTKVTASGLTAATWTWDGEGGGVTPDPGPTPTNKQHISFTESDVAESGLNGKVFSDGDFKITIVDVTNNKFNISANSGRFADDGEIVYFSYSIYGGGSANDNGRRIDVTIPSDGYLRIFVRTANKDATDRNLVVMQDNQALFDQVIQTANEIIVNNKSCDPIVTVPVKQGTVMLLAPIGALRYYAFEFIPQGSSDVKKCAAPTVAYTRGKLTFSSTTPGATFYSTIADSDIGSYQTSEVSLSVTYTVSVYAEAPDYERSETTWVTLCWIDATPATDIQEETKVEARPVLIESRGGMLTISGLENGTPVSIYGSGGQQTNKAVADSATLSVDSRLARGSVAIVKMGDKAVKIVVR